MFLLLLLRGSEALPKPRHPGTGCGLPFLLCQVPCPAFLVKVGFGWQSPLLAVLLLSPDYSLETLADCLDDIYCLCSRCVLHLRIPRRHACAPHTQCLALVLHLHRNMRDSRHWVINPYVSSLLSQHSSFQLTQEQEDMVRQARLWSAGALPHTHTLQGTHHHTVGLGENRPSISHVAKMH